jgi:uncharacterized protein (DUF2267 family)
MEYNAFLERVQQQGDFSSSEAESAVRTIFTTFAQQLPPPTTDQLQADLPPELARYFAENHGSPTEAFSLDTFFGRLSDESGLDMSTSSQYARAVMSALREELAPDQFQTLRSALPPEFISMFDTGESSMVAGS